jgi:hypothetical protein
MQMKDLERPHRRSSKSISHLVFLQSKLILIEFLSEQDDASDTLIRPQEIAPLDAMKTISYDELKIILEYMDNEIKRIRANADTLLSKKASFDKA